jgi:hypothetical protein
MIFSFYGTFTSLWSIFFVFLSIHIWIHQILVRKYEGKRLHGRPKHMWEYNIKVGLKEMGVCGLDLFDLEWGPVLGS